MVLPPELRDQGLYDASGCHLGGLYEPLMVDGQLTGALAVMRAARPAERLIWHNLGCQNPQADLGLLWAMPATPNPLAVTLGVLGYLVAAIDAGQSVKLHAVDEAAIDTVCAQVAPMVGGGHA